LSSFKDIKLLQKPPKFTAFLNVFHMIIPKFIFKQKISSKNVKNHKSLKINKIIIFRTQYEREEKISTELFKNLSEK